MRRASRNLHRSGRSRAYSERVYARHVVPEAPLDRDENGLAAAGAGWFVLSARDARWRERPGRGQTLVFEGDTDFLQIGLQLAVLGPGELLSMYHWEADEEDFLVLAGEGLLLIEGEERPLRAWDFVHCPPEAAHTIVGAGRAPCVVLAVGARERTTTVRPDGRLDVAEGWGGYPVDEAASRYDAGVDVETSDPEQAYARFEDSRPVPYGGWLPD